jgi:four helix bundle protein
MAGEIVSYRDLVVWQRAMELADLVYTLTETFPSRERFGLAFQMRKAAVSIASNIAEGTRHRTPGYLSRVIIALGEHAELETQALLAHRRRLVSVANMAAFETLSASVGQLLHGLSRSLEGLISSGKDHMSSSGNRVTNHK